MIHRRIAEVAARRPEAPAVVGRGERLSYGELARRARALALHLRGLGVGPEDRIGVAMERTVDLVPALLGVLEAGAAYLPLDLAYPAERLGFMLEDGGARAVLLGTREGAGAAAVTAAAQACGARRIDLGCGGEGWPALPGGAPLEPAPFGPDPGNLAYVIYTSGSTGRPKGVAIEHRSAGALVDWALGEFSAEELAATLAATSVCFDLSVFELFVPLAAGGTVVLAEDALELPRLPTEPPVTLVNTVPSAMTELVAGGGVPGSVRTVNLAGEALRRPLVDAIYERTGARRVLNLYGPSEDTTYSTWDVVAREEAEAPTIGRPVDGTCARVLDPRGRSVPEGEAGDLHLGGAGLARGYLGRPGLTAERFVPDPEAGTSGARLYRTGDLARRLPDGRLDYLGRIDHQVKVRGFRIELGEVETALLAQLSVHEAVAVAHDGAGGKVLVAYVAYVAGAGGGAGPAPDGEDLRAHLARSLPAHMVPSRFVVLPALPRTPNGKVDRSALPAPASEPDGGAGEPPATSVETRLAELWREVLEVDAVGRSSHFVHLGGHSLLATRLLSRVRDAFGAELPMADLFAAPTLSGFAARVEAARGSAPVLPALRPRPAAETTVPPSYAQQRLWVLDRLQPGLATYNLPSAFRLLGSLDRAALARALAEVVRRHEALRTRFVEVDGRPYQRIEPATAPALPRVDLSALPEATRAAELGRITGAEARRPFDLGRGPVLRSLLVSVAPVGGDHLLLLTLHHVVADAWSQGVLNVELSALYGALAASRPSPLSPLPVQYADFALWQRAWPPRVLDDQLDHWRRRLAGAGPLELPTDRSRPAIQSFRGSAVRFEVPAELADGVEALARGDGATPFMAWLALFLVLLRRHTGSDDLVVGTPVANRRRSELEGLIGFFVNLLPLRVETAGAPPFRRHLARVREAALDAFDHQDLPFERLVAELRPERDLSRNPLCQVAFQLLDRPVPQPELPGLTVRRIDPPFETTRFDLALTLTRAEGRLTGEIELASDLFDTTTVVRLAGHLLTVAAAVAADGAARPVDELPLLTRGERHALSLEPSGARALDPAAAEPVHLRVLRRAAETPDALAVAGGAGEHLTFGELARRSGHLAGVLRRLLAGGGHGPGTPVALCLERSPDFVTAALAALRAGAAYLPLDPAYPAERLAFMARDAGAPVAVCRRGAVAALTAPGRELLLLEAGRFPAAEARPASDDRSAGGASTLEGDPLAYVIYTSGSTGRPKGVGVGHRALSNLVAWHLGAFALSERDRTTQLAQVGFDASVWELWPALAAGAPLHLPPEEVRSAPEALRDWLVARGITIGFAPTPLAEALVALPWPAGTALRTLLTGGDRLHAPPPSGLPFTLVNDYGPTENAVVATSAPVSPATTSHGAPAPSIGRAIDGVRVHVLDPGLRPLSLGVPGELCLAGESLARGYLGRPALTAERFVPDPLALAVPGARLYRTGDLARRLPDASFEFLGRADRQVKVRGFRIEPGEIEAVLARQPGVREAAVVAPAAASGSRRLVAYVATGSGPEGGPAVSDLRDALARELPDYMVPSLLMPLPALPATPSGKVDRRALAERAAREVGEGLGGHEAPLASETEELLAGIWRRVLAVDAVGRDDDFFHLGGHSLLAAQVVSRIRDDLGVEVPLRALFTEPTLAGLARAVETERRARLERALPPLVPVARGPRSPLSSAQQRLWFLARLDPDDPTYNIPTAFRLRGPLDRPALAWSLGEVVRRHETLRTRFGETEEGPYQEVLAPGPAAPPVADLTALPAARRAAEAARLARREAWRTFDLASGSLLRSLLVATVGGDRPEHVLLLVMHHVASDGWSQAILHRELSAHYRYRRGSGPAPAVPAVQYADFAHWQRGWLSGERIERQLSYWTKHLAGAPAVLELPTDRPRPPVRSHRGAELPVMFPAARVAPLRALARERGVTLFMALLAGFQALLGRLTGRRDVLVGSVVANRNHSEIEELIGFFVNALVMRGDLNPEGDREPTFDELLRRARRTALDAYGHQDLPFERLVDELRPERSLSHQPLIQVMFGLQNVPLPPLELPGVAAEEAGVAGAVARFDLTLALFDDGAGLHGVFEYATDLFDRATVARLSGHLEALLAGAAEDPGRSVALLPLLTPAERHQAVVEWNDTHRVSRLGATIHGRFREQVARRPGAVAAVWRGRELTYGELGERSARLARFLAGLGTSRGTPVGIWMERSLDMVTAVLGVLEAGGCYLPLDAAWPAERVETILASHRAPVLLTRSERLPAALDLRWRLERLADVVCLDVETPEPPPEPVDREGVLALWDFVAERATDRVSAAGLVSSLTGEPFSAAEVDEYRDRVVALAEPRLAAADGDARVLEVGCGSGLILERLAPRAARYVGVDPSPRTQNQNREAARRRLAAGEDPGVDPERDLPVGFAHELDEIPAADGPFDLVVLASTVQFFPGPLYLERVLDLALSRLAPGGAVLVADVMDARRRAELEAAIAAHATGSGGDGSRSTQGQELFLDEAQFGDFAASRSAVARVEVAHRTEGFDNELGYRYDVVLERGERAEAPARPDRPDRPDRLDGGAHPERSRRLWTGWHLHRQQDRPEPAPPPAVVGPDDLAYVIHTSGSTGAPKGIAVQHRPVVHLIDWIHRTFGVGPADRLLFVTSLCFDLSVYDLFGTLAAGGTIHVASEEELEEPAALVRLLADGGITIWDSAPAALQRLAPLFPEPPATRSPLRLALLSGDWIPVALPDRVRRAFPACRVVSLGGATEATIWSNWYPVGRVDPGWPSIPYGRPIADARYHVLDRSLEPLPAGAPGDLFIGGEVLCVGYSERPALTAERFVPDPFARRPDEAGARLYRTGDRARHFTDGNLEFLGRVDHQVKVRGFRIELGEIEVTLERHPSVREAVVLAPFAPGGDRRLVGYVVPAPGATAAAAELREHLRRSLPEYMVPADVLSLAAMPVTPNGKLDRKALAEMEPAATQPGRGGADAGAPAGPTEELVAGVWREVLEVEAPGRRDNFFALGGNSLLATQVVARLRARFGVEVPLRALFQRPTLAELAADVEAARGGFERSEVPPLVPVSPEDLGGPPPLSFSQLRLWFLVQVEPASGDYNLPLTLRWTGSLAPAVLRRALTAVVQRHEVLRTAFVARRGRPEPVVRRHAVPALPVVDLAALPAGAREVEVRRLVAEDVRAPFDLTRAPLLRAALLRLGAAEHLLRLTVHHIVFDGWSLGILTRELAHLYRDLAAGRPPGLEPLPVQYGDYAFWQHRWLGGALLDDQLAFWRSRLAGAPPMLLLPTDRPRPAVQSYRGGAVTFTLPSALGGRLRALAAREGVTRFMVLLAAFDTLLFRLTGQDDLSVGTFVANRRWREIEPLIGFFVNTLVLRSDLSGGPTFRDLLARVRETTLSAYEHQELPFERLLEALDPERDLSRTPLFQVMFGLQNFAVPRIDRADEGGGAVEAVDLFEEGRTNADLALWTWEEEGDRIRGWLQYNGDLFDRTTARRLAGHLESLLSGLAGAPDACLSELPLLAAGARHQVVTEWTGEGRPLASGSRHEAPTVLERFHARAAERPDATAVVAGARALSFGALARRVASVARWLSGAGAAPETVVAVCRERSPEQIATLLAVQAAGAAYLPLDPQTPVERVATIVRDAGVSLLVADAGEVGRLEAALAGTPVRVVSSPSPGDAPAADPRLRAPDPDSRAYVIYTSGSTGTPKGVQVSHRALAAFATAAVDAYALMPHDRVLQFASAAFDASVEEIFATLGAGATMVLRDEAMLESPARFLELCAAHRLTVTDLPTAFWHALASHLDRNRQAPGARGGRAEVPAELRLVIIGGEAASPEAVAAWLRAIGRRPALVNTYGPTEATVVATAAALDRPGAAGHGGSAPIGRSFAGASSHVLDAALRPVPAGVAGELVLGGPSLARGYLGRPALTAERFVPSPVAGSAGARLYRTGDLARRRPDGVLDFLGRRDEQVKVRGFRVEPGEIAAELCRHPAVREAVVVLRTPGGGGEAAARLVAYFTGDDSPPDPGELREHLRHTLPAYMVPADYVHLPALPVTPHGKVDHRALPAPAPADETTGAPPTNPTEEIIARAWCELLGLPRVGIYDDFFDLGGHSLLAPQLIARLEESFDVTLRLPVLFQAPTVAELAVAVERHLLAQIEELSDEEIESRLEGETSVAGAL